MTRGLVVLAFLAGDDRRGGRDDRAGVVLEVTREQLPYLRVKLSCRLVVWQLLSHTSQPSIGEQYHRLPLTVAAMLGASTRPLPRP